MDMANSVGRRSSIPKSTDAIDPQIPVESMISSDTVVPVNVWPRVPMSLTPSPVAFTAEEESVDYAEAAVYWGEARVAHSERYEPH